METGTEFGVIAIKHKENDDHEHEHVTRPLIAFPCRTLQTSFSLDKELSPVKNGAEPGRVGPSCAECADDPG